MAKYVQSGQVSFREAEVFTLDEFGGLLPGDSGLCVQQLRHSLIDHIDLPPEQFHFLHTEAENLDAECLRYDEAIGHGFDLTLLGVGLNGHLGMNEPGTPADRTTHTVVLHPTTVEASRRYLTHTQAPTWGVTVGLKQLLESWASRANFREFDVHQGYTESFAFLAVACGARYYKNLPCKARA